MAQPLLDEGGRITVRWSSAGTGVPTSRLEAANKKARTEPSARLAIQQIPTPGMQASYLRAFCDSEPFWSAILALITGPPGFERPVMFTADPEPAID